MRTRKKFRAVVSILLSVILSVTMMTAWAAAVDIEGAFSDNESALAREYMEKYGWDESKFLVREWKSAVDGEDVEFERAAGYQKDFLEDNILTTRKYLGLSETGRMESNGADTLVKIALQELAAQDNKEDPPGSNNVKYNTWFYGKEVSGDGYPWNCTFVTWCADQCGFISSKLFQKTNSCASLYKYMVNENGFNSYQVMNTTPMGGAEYTPRPGDLMFFFEGKDESTCVHVGIIVKVTNNGIFTVEGNSNDTVEKNYYHKDIDYPAALNGRIIQVNYPLTFADGGSKEANAPIIFNFLTTCMSMTPAGACAAMGNMAIESGLMPDKTEYGYTWESGAGYGLIQWTNVSGNGRVPGLDSAYLISPGQPYKEVPGHRRTNLVNWCVANGYDHKTLSGQLYFLKYELESASRYKSALSQMASQSNSLAGSQMNSDIWLQKIEGLPRSNRYWATQSPLRKKETAQFWSQFGQG